MDYSPPDDGRLFPFDASTITGLRIDGAPGVTTVDAETANVLTAGGETWFSWEHEGVRRAVNTRHIAEVFARRQVATVIDLTEPGGQLAREVSRLRFGAMS